MSRFVSASEQGQLQGANASVTGIANLFGPGAFHAQRSRSRLAAARDGISPGRPFLIAVFLLAAAGILAWLCDQGCDA